MLKSIFYARFHPEKGSTVLHQVPEGSIIPCPPSLTAQTPLFEYKSVADYIIPRREFCDRLVAICVNKHRIVGFPVCIHDDERYSRNDFIFNFCLVLDEEAPFAAYASVIRKLARLLRNLEEQGQFLSVEEEREDVVLAGEEGYGGGSKVYALCEMILEDLNNYCECMIPIDESNTVNLKLFPSRAPPPSIHGWHVPLSLVRFESLQVNTWDLTVQRIIPHINGINSVARIASLADTDSTLTRRAIAHLLYYGCICLLDIFQFSAVYAPTPEIAVFFADVNMQDECRRYVASPYSPFGKVSSSSTTSAVPEPGASSSSATAAAAPPSSSAAIAPPPAPGSKATSPAAVRSGSRLNPARSDLPTTTTPGPTTSSPSSLQIPSRATILELYSTLRQGLSLRDWCLTHSSSLHNIDVRRFITFAKIKGFVYRCHKYAVALRPSDNKLNLNGESEDGTEIVDPILKARMAEKSWRKAAMSSGWQTPRHLSGKKGFIEAGDVGLVDANNAVVAAREEGGGGAAAGGASVPTTHNGTPADAAAAAAATTNNNNNNATVGGGEGGVGGERGGIEFTDLAMSRYLDGLHCLDEISTDLQTSEREATRRLKKAARGGEVVFIHR